MLYCATQLCTIICTLIWAVLTDELCFGGIRFCGFLFYCGSLFVLRLVILCFVYLLFATVRLSVPVQLTALKDSSPKWPIMCRMGRFKALALPQFLHLRCRGALVPVSLWLLYTPMFQRRHSSLIGTRPMITKPNYPSIPWYVRLSWLENDYWGSLSSASHFDA